MKDLSFARPSAVRYGVLAWVCSLSLLTYIDRVCIKTVGADMRRDLGLSEQQFGAVFAAFALAYALFEVPGGWLGDRLGPRRVIGRVVLWWSLFTALTAAVWTFTLDSGLRLPLPRFRWEVWDGGLVVSLPDEIPLLLNAFVLLLAIRFLFGAGEAGAYPNISKALRNWFPPGRRGLTQGMPWVFGRWGGAVAPLLVGLLAVQFGLGWRGTFVAFGLLGVVWTAGFLTFFRDTPQEHYAVNEAEKALIAAGRAEEGAPAPLSWRALLTSRTLWLLAFMYFCSNCGWCFFITWDVEYYRTVLGVDRWALKLVSGAALFCGGIACALGGLLTDWQVRLLGRRWGRTAQGSLAYLLAGSFFFLALQTRDPWLAIPALCAASFLKDLAIAVSWSTCVDIGHRYSGTVSGFMNMVGNLGTVVSPPLVAAFAEGGQWERALVYSGAMFYVSAFCWLFIDPRRVVVYDVKGR